jgi:hypothetical protein
MQGNEEARTCSTIRDIRNLYIVLIEKPEVMKPLGNLSCNVLTAASRSKHLFIVLTSSHALQLCDVLSDHWSTQALPANTSKTPLVEIICHTDTFTEG